MPEARIAFQHQSEVRRIIYGEFDLEMSIEILREAQRELDAALLQLEEDEDIDAASWNYSRDLRRAERFAIYGDGSEE